MLSDTRMEEQVLCSLAEDALTNGDVKVASDYFAQLTRDNPDNTLHHSRLAECHYRYLKHLSVHHFQSYEVPQTFISSSLLKLYINSGSYLNVG